MKPFAPMLASPADLDKLRFPVYASAKIDGIRGVVHTGKLLTRKLLELPNRHVFGLLSTPELEGLDGELVVGSARDKNVMQKTTSGLMRHEGAPDFRFWAFDLHNHEGSFEKRFNALEKLCTLYVRNKYGIAILPQKLIKNIDDLLSFEQQIVGGGFEGVILRDPQSPYKYGRSTAREGYLLKVKRFQDSEAQIIGFEEEQENTNEAQKDNLGRTKRSSAKSGKVGKGTLGAFVVRDIYSGVELNVGGGLTAEQRVQFWTQRKELMGKTVKYKFFPVGVKEAPRHPVLLGFRDERDMS